MMSVRTARIAIATTLVAILAVAITVVATPVGALRRNTFVAYFANTNGLYTGDEVRILGVAVGTVDEIDPQPNAAKVTFSVDREYPVPADVQAAILSPSLVSARAIQLVPAYSSGPKLADGATIPKERTAVPVEWDDLRQQLEKLTDSLQPTTPGGPSPVGEFINSAADNLRGEGDTARDTVIKLSKAVSARCATCSCWYRRCPPAAISSPPSTQIWPTSPPCCPIHPTRWPMRHRASTAR
jgi:phospholipid/cholesterol/gamma-HCH transport system substrate-binding protein